MDTLNASDGLALHQQTWSPTGPTRGTVVIVHGLGEHIGRYAALASALTAQGWRVCGHDQRGHGRSGGARAMLPRPDALLRDLSLVIDHARLGLADGAPLVLLGHSMGGAVAARFVAEGLAADPADWSRTPDALVLSSPALAVDLTALQRLQLWVGERLLPHVATANGLQADWMSRDPAVVQAYLADPLVHDRMTPRLARFVVDAGAQARAAAPRWRVPTLLMWAGADRCVRPEGAAAMAAAAPREVLASRAFPSLAHEIFNEPEREQVLTHLLGWLDGVGLVSAARRRATPGSAA